MLERGQKIVLNHLLRIDLRVVPYLKLDAFPFEVHKKSSEPEIGKQLRQFIMGHLHMLRMQFHLILGSDLRIEFLESTAIAMVHKDNLPEMVKGKTDGHVVQQGLAPVLIFILCKTQAGTRKNEMIVVHLQTERVKETDGVVDKAEVHAGNGKAFRLMDCAFVNMVWLAPHRRYYNLYNINNNIGISIYYEIQPSDPIHTPEKLESSRP